MALEEIREERMRKLNILRADGIDPYPASSARTHTIAEIVAKFTTIVEGKKTMVIAGRVRAKREHGGSVFVDCADGSGSMQLFFKKDILGEAFPFFLETVDIGDFIEAEGRLFETQRGEKTLEVSRWSMLSKSLLPLPEKWHGLQDVEERFRRRYLELLMNDEVRLRFEMRSRIISKIRKWHEKHEFLEVETPIFHQIPGGTLATPFVTHHNALDIDLYLRVAPELYLKRLLVGGFERVFEMGKSFRNEGIDANHNPEFTEPECYAAYWDEEQMMAFTEGLFVELAREFGTDGAVMSGEESIKFTRPFARISFKELLSRFALIVDYDAETRDSLAVCAARLGVDAGPNDSKGTIADMIYKKVCRPYLCEPTFLTHHPYEISPLAKRWPHQPHEVRRFQLVVGGMELANGFAELNDPIDQRARLVAQEQARAGGEAEAHRMDEDYVEALEYGMPPAAGLGIGADRVVMLFTGAKNIREVILFPTMRPKKET